MPQRRPQADDAGGGNWMVTFSDCMTLLLTFFVMLLSFSSFDPRPTGRMGGVLREPSNPSVQQQKRIAMDSPVEPIETPTDQTEEGEETRSSESLDPTLKPRPPEDPLSADAYCDRRVLTIPSEVLFWGQGAQVTPKGKGILADVAAYLRLVPSQVVICETVAPDPTSSRADAETQSLRRALAVLGHFTRTEQIGPERFSISTAVGAAGSRAEAESVVCIAILNPKVYP